MPSVYTGEGNRKWNCFWCILGMCRYVLEKRYCYQGWTNHSLGKIIHILLVKDHKIFI